MFGLFGAVIKIIGSLVIVFIFFSMVVVKNATSEDGGAGVEDKDESTPGNQVYPPHMWKGVAIWLGVIYAVVNLIAIATSF